MFAAAKRNRDGARATGLVLIITWPPWLNQKMGKCGAVAASETLSFQPWFRPPPRCAVHDGKNLSCKRVSRADGACGAIPHPEPDGWSPVCAWQHVEA